jgi:adenine phosphoribosyltransferase
MENEDLFRLIRTVLDFPKPGILFYDLTTLLQDPAGYQATIDRMCLPWMEKRPEIIAGIDARGFLLAGAMAHKLGAGVALVRKAGKLPSTTFNASYTLEYGEATLEIHADSFARHRRVLIVDDLLATGGTAAATIELVRQAGGEIEGLEFVIELEDLGGAAKLQGLPVRSLISVGS